MEVEVVLVMGTGGRGGLARLELLAGTINERIASMTVDQYCSQVVWHEPRAEVVSHS